MEKRIKKDREPYRIAVTGPESCGKSELAEKLAAVFHTVWVPEYARQYLDEINRPYDYEDLLSIARGQKQLVETLLPQASEVIVADTELLVIKIWSEFKYGKCDPEIIKHLNEQEYDLYLLCDIDLPWEFDSLREHPERRQELFALYQNEMIRRAWPFEVISGSGEKRLKNAMNAVRKHIPALEEMI
jgi:NadR type nicotinamide-nucleotide adenylyltransferase